MSDDPLQALESCANIVKQVSESVAPQRAAMVERIKRLIEAATGESEEGDRRGRLKFLAPEWPEEVLVELAMLYFQVCGRDMQLVCWTMLSARCTCHFACPSMQWNLQGIKMQRR